MEEGPFSGPFKEGWRIVCPPVGGKIRYLRLVLVPPVLLGALLVGALLNWDRFPEHRWSLLCIVPGFVISVYGAYTYSTRVRHPARVLELTPDSVMLFEKGKGNRPVVDIPYTRDVEVDVYLRPDPNWESRSMLYGWTFRKGDELLRLHPDENWDLWRLQDMYRPVIWLVERHHMSMGEDLRRYIAQVEKDEKEPADGT